MALITKHFKEKELICQCCGKQKMGSLFMDLVEACRVISRIPFRVTSGWRCEKHNREIGGHPTSAHMEGLAIDIARSSPTKDRDILEEAKFLKNIVSKLKRVWTSLKSKIKSLLSKKLKRLGPGEETVVTIPGLKSENKIEYMNLKDLLNEGALQAIKGNYNEALTCQYLYKNDGKEGVEITTNTATQTLTNKTLTSPDINTPDIDGGTIDAADVTVGSGKTLNVSAGTLTTSAAQNLAILQGAGANADIGAFELRAATFQSDIATGTAPMISHQPQRLLTSTPICLMV